MIEEARFDLVTVQSGDTFAVNDRARVVVVELISAFWLGRSLQRQLTISIHLESGTDSCKWWSGCQIVMLQDHKNR
jgi:hypothetical protein